MILLDNFVCILNKKTTPQYIKYTTLKSESSCLGQLSLSDSQLSAKCTGCVFRTKTSMKSQEVTQAILVRNSLGSLQGLIFELMFGLWTFRNLSESPKICNPCIQVCESPIGGHSPQYRKLGSQLPSSSPWANEILPSTWLIQLACCKKTAYWGISSLVSILEEATYPLLAAHKAASVHRPHLEQHIRHS